MPLNELDVLKLNELIQSDLPAPEQLSLARLLIYVSPSSCEKLSEEDIDDFGKVRVGYTVRYIRYDSALVLNCLRQISVGYK